MSLKVFNLQCHAGHLFEGWFGSHDDYDTQQERGLVSCPMCHSAEVKKMPSAPRINSSRTLVPASELQGAEGASSHVTASQTATGDTAQQQQLQQLQKLQAVVLSHLREAVSSAEDVGEAFAEEARAIHEGEAQARSIRGIASEQERQELAEDGIAIMQVPDFLGDERLQ